MVMVGSVLKSLPIDPQVIEGVVLALSKKKGVEVNLKALSGGDAASRSAPPPLGG
jgi:indolepyruvate ferredoxin oxidoreductase beta subunit